VSPAPVSGGAAPLRRTSSGMLRGRSEPGYEAYLGIPYAEPPTGPRRFALPVPPGPFGKVLDARFPGPACPQTPWALERLVGGEPGGHDEDCLRLNVWTPPGAEGLPVMVFVHGGSFLHGSGTAPWYDGGRLAARRHVVVVTLNYRLGGLGFLDLPGDQVEEPNLGLADQLAALAWVRREIEHFGGDPRRVTVFGESAGAISIAAVLGSPSAAGHFDRAILQSGAASNLFSRSEAQALGRRLAELLGVPPELDRLRSLDAMAIAEASSRLSGASGTALPFRPVVGTPLVPVDPLDAVAAGAASGIDLIVGTNRDEMALFSLGDPERSSLDAEGVARRIETRFGRNDGVDLVRLYARLAPDASPSDWWQMASTDAVFRAPAERLCEAHAVHARVWRYLFAWRSPAFNGALGSCHAMDLPFVFDTVDVPGTALLLGNGEERHQLADAMSQAWTRFAAEGEPKGPEALDWPEWNMTSRVTMVINEAWEVVEDPESERRLAWQRHGLPTRP
jgi:para-nitrobenzyl esterase